MPYYKPIKKYPLADRKRILSGLRRLREQLAGQNFPIKKYSKSLFGRTETWTRVKK